MQRRVPVHLPRRVDGDDLPSTFGRRRFVKVAVAVGRWRQSFYRVDTALVVPGLTATDYRLRIHGMVDHSLDLCATTDVSREASGMVA